jgi:hypothetical protein
MSLFSFWKSTPSSSSSSSSSSASSVVATPVPSTESKKPETRKESKEEKVVFEKPEIETAEGEEGTRDKPVTVEEQDEIANGLYRQLANETEEENKILGQMTSVSTKRKLDLTDFGKKKRAKWDSAPSDLELNDLELRIKDYCRRTDMKFLYQEASSSRITPITLPRAMNYLEANARNVLRECNAWLQSNYGWYHGTPEHWILEYQAEKEVYAAFQAYFYVYVQLYAASLQLKQTNKGKLNDIRDRLASLKVLFLRAFQQNH